MLAMYRTCASLAVFAALLWSSSATQSRPEALRARIEALRASPGTSIAGRRLFNVEVVTQFLESRGFVAPWNAVAITEICTPSATSMRMA
jgi:hypothetical protein